MAQVETEASRGGPGLKYWIPMVALILLVLVAALTGAYIFGKSQASGKSDAEVDNEVRRAVSIQKAKDKKEAAADLTSAVQEARRKTRKTWQARLKAETARASSQAGASQQSDSDSGTTSSDPCYGVYDPEGIC